MIFKVFKKHNNTKDYMWFEPKLAPFDEHQYCTVILCLLSTEKFKFIYNIHFERKASCFKI